MKKIFTLNLLLSSFCLLAQIPNGYYNNATGTGYNLKTQLKTIISNGHSGKSYDNLFTDVKGFKATDVDIFYENDGSILDMYSENPTGADAYNYSYYANDKCGNYQGESDCYNGEHFVPQSTYNSAMPMVGDIHQLTPTDGYVNNRRSNFPFANISNPTWTSNNGSKLGRINISGYSGFAFEPIDEFKGDVARILFYFATRYENQVSNYSFPMFNGTSNQVFKTDFLNMLLQWHQNDPVSNREIHRNNKAYLYQGNRNPFIDHPEYVQQIWGSSLSTEDLNLLADLSVYPNPSNNHKINIEIDIVLDEIQLISINGQMIQKIQKPNASGNTYSLENLPSGFYFLKISAKNQSTTKKIVVN
ncbi:T9SS type A sorting domain-containing protein [Flavobacterium sp. NST-5]|uniref:T9SS type A sorting domain-containing protein n=1 Tax=Flavobacterium ichthyis TaxID=2698827 RepID=A0ABW9Z6N3_9FLAO|nr:endonuclease [Flavobacterium ichthyis]NBL64222.1 T9SS type A sorting domain-containing protein [Flavobacterium ichthyis]